MPLTELAKRLGVSHGTARNRLERLITNSVMKVAAIVDPTKLGFPVQVFMGIDADLNEAAEIENELANFEEVTFVSTLTGRFDLMIGAAFASNAHL